VRQANAARHFDRLEQEVIEETEWGAQQFPADAHAPVPEAVDGHRPEALLQETVVVSPQVLPEEGPQPHAGRVLVRLARRQRRIQEVIHGYSPPFANPMAPGRLKRRKSQSSSGGSVSGFRVGTLSKRQSPAAGD